MVSKILLLLVGLSYLVHCSRPLDLTKLEVSLDPRCQTLKSRVVTIFTRACDPAKRSAAYAHIYNSLPRASHGTYSILFPIGHSSDCEIGDVAERGDLTSCLVQGTYEDSYQNLPYKTASTMQLLSNSPSAFSWWIKVDDDMEVDYQVLDSYLTALEQVTSYLARYRQEALTVENRFPPLSAVIHKLFRTWFRYWWIGCELIGNKIIRKGANAELGYNSPYYPIYMSGPLYILSSDSVHELFQELRRNQTIYTSEDAMIGILAFNLRNNQTNPVILRDIWEPNIVTLPSACRKPTGMSFLQPSVQIAAPSMQMEPRNGTVPYWREHWFQMLLETVLPSPTSSR